jgi:RND family efflux transporter MFP subunit
MSHSTFVRCFFFFFGVSFFLTGCGREDSSSAVGSDVVRPVIYHEVRAAVPEFTRSFPARIAAADMRELVFPVPGVVLPVPVRESDSVVSGQLLAQLDSRDYESALSAARARVENAIRELERAQRLFKEDAVSKSVLEQREAAAEVARAEFDAAEKALADTRIEAPFSGIVSRVFVEASQAVSPGTSAVRIFSKEDLEATIAVPASLIVNADGSQREQKGAVVRLAADPEQGIEAAFRKAELEADAGSQSFAVTFSFQSPEGLNVLPGMNAEVDLTIEDPRVRSGGVEVPLRAVASQGEGHFVWVIDTSVEPHRVEPRAVTVGVGVGEMIPMTQGIEPGETIVAAGVSALVEGIAVRLWSRSAE